MLNERIIGKEFALSGSEQNPDLTGRSARQVLGRVTQDIPAPVRAFLDHGEDFVRAVHERYTGPKDPGFLDRAWTYQRWVGVYMLTDHFEIGKTSWSVAPWG